MKEKGDKKIKKCPICNINRITIDVEKCALCESRESIKEQNGGVIVAA